VPWEQIERLGEECQCVGVVATQVLAVPRGAVLCVVGSRAPNGSKRIAQPNPPGTFRVVAIGSNGNSFADFPTPPVSCPDQIGG